MTSSQRIAAVALLAASLTLLVSAVFFRTWPMRGWLGVVCYAVIGLVSVSGVFALPRRLALAFGAYFFWSAASFGLPRIWTDRPTWLDVAVTVLQMVAMTWMIVELLRRRPGAAVAS